MLTRESTERVRTFIRLSSWKAHFVSTVFLSDYQSWWRYLKPLQAIASEDFYYGSFDLELWPWHLKVNSDIECIWWTSLPNFMKMRLLLFEKYFHRHFNKQTKPTNMAEHRRSNYSELCILWKFVQVFFHNSIIFIFQSRRAAHLQWQRSLVWSRFLQTLCSSLGSTVWVNLRKVKKLILCQISVSLKEGRSV